MSPTFDASTSDNGTLMTSSTDFGYSDGWDISEGDIIYEHVSDEDPEEDLDDSIESEIFDIGEVVEEQSTEKMDLKNILPVGTPRSRNWILLVETSNGDFEEHEIAPDEDVFIVIDSTTEEVHESDPAVDGGLQGKEVDSKTVKHRNQEAECSLIKKIFPNNDLEDSDEFAGDNFDLF